MFWEKWFGKAKETAAEKPKQVYNDFILQYGKHLLNDSTVYYFYPFMPGVSGDFPPMSMAAMRELFHDFHVVTHVKTFSFRQTKKEKTPDSKNQFPFQYYNSLTGEGGRAGVYYNGGTELITITHGPNDELMEIMMGEDSEVWGNSLCMYGYRSNPFEHPDFDTVKAALGPEACDIYIEYAGQGEDLEIEVAHGSLTTEYIIELFQRLCGEHNQTVEVRPPQPPIP